MARLDRAAAPQNRIDDPVDVALVQIAQADVPDDWQDITVEAPLDFGGGAQIGTHVLGEIGGNEVGHRHAGVG